MPQMPLFENELIHEQEPKGLVLRSRPDRPLTKAQRAFNRLVARVEELRKHLEDETDRLDKALVYYGKNLHPRQQRLNALRKSMVRSLAPFFESKQLKGKRQHETLRMIIEDQLHEIVQEEGSLKDEELRKIFERIFGVNIEQAEREEVEQARSFLDEMFGDLGIDVDLSDLRPDMSEEEVARKAAEMAAQLHQKEEEKCGFNQAERPRSKKQLEKEQRAQEADQARRKSISTIYKQLARVLHPDLESDAGRREQKVGLMQELTVAYRNNDLHTLLRMELEWIRQEETSIERLADEKLAVYNQVLRDQVRELELQLAAMPYDPRYQALLDDDELYGPSLRTDGPAQARELDEIIADMEATLARLNTSQALHEVRDVIRAYRVVNDTPF
jgi:hypothetical protein